MPEDSVACTSLALQSPGTKRRSGGSEVATVPILDQFLIGDENKAISELFSAESIRQLEERSPIFLFGPTGVGKTSIALTLMSRWINDQTDRRFQAIQGLDFAKLFLRSIEADDMPRFRSHHRECHGLLIDNVHELIGKDAVQSELVEIMNSAEQNRQLVVLTGMSIPSFIPSWNDALVSRLLAGYSLEIRPPSSAIRLEILTRLANTERLQASREDLSRLNNQLPEGCTVVQIKGVITRWCHQQKLDSALDQRVTPKSLERLAETQNRHVPSPSEIAKSVAKEMHLTLESMRGPSRKANVVRARGLAMLLIRQWTETSFQGIGELFGGRDHTTVMHACKKTEEELSLDPELSHCADRIRQKLM